MATSPAWQFYGGDWKKDPALARCTLATRAFWLELLDAMEQENTYQIEATDAEYARIARCSESEAAECIAELKRTRTANVSLINDAVTLCHAPVTLIVSRRLQRQYHERDQQLARQRRCRNSAKNESVTLLSRSSSSSPSSSTSKPPPSTSSQPEPKTEPAEVAAAEPSQLFPETEATIQEAFPGTPDVVFEAIVEEAFAAHTDVGDGELAAALRATRWPKQYSAKAWLKKIGPYLHRRPLAKPAARSPGCATCGGDGRVHALTKGDFPTTTAWLEAMAVAPEAERYKPCPECAGKRAGPQLVAERRQTG